VAAVKVQQHGTSSVHEVQLPAVVAHASAVEVEGEKIRVQGSVIQCEQYLKKVLDYSQWVQY
jgi:hypothetical protein